MNLSLLDPFVLAQDCPELMTGSLRNGHSSTIAFSPSGNLLASGRLTGTIVIFDFDTGGVALKLRGHSRQVQSLSWARSDRFLLSASQDWKAVVWDLETGDRVTTIRFEAAVFCAELRPPGSRPAEFEIVAALFERDPQMLDLSTGTARSTTLPSIPLRPASEPVAKVDLKNTTTVAIYSPRGKYIFAGTNKGWLNVISAHTGTLLHSVRLSSSVTIMIRFAPDGRGLLVNSADRIIRAYLVGTDVDEVADPSTADESTDRQAPRQLFTDENPFEISLSHKLQDLVSRHSWNHVGFSCSGEYAFASTFMNHTIYIWERTLGTLVKILDGPKEEFSVVDWHPSKPVIAAVGLDSGSIFLWAVPTGQRWSALAPDFVEVEENVEYVEAEDEFDMRPIEELEQRRRDAEDEQDVDVLTLPAGLSGRWSSHDTFHLPVNLKMGTTESDDDVAIPTSGRRSPDRRRKRARPDR